MVDHELEFGSYTKRIDYRNSNVEQVLETKTESIKPASPTNRELAVQVLSDMLIESLSGGYKSVAVEVELKADKTIKVIRKSCCRRVKL